MNAKDLETFSHVPFLFWVKDTAGTYVWGNQAINQLAGEDVVGKTDHELVWKESADALRAEDKRALDSGSPIYLQERVDQSSRGGATLNVCKWPEEFEGKPCCFGISFTIE